MLEFTARLSYTAIKETEHEDEEARKKISKELCDYLISVIDAKEKLAATIGKSV